MKRMTSKYSVEGVVSLVRESFFDCAKKAIAAYGPYSPWNSSQKIGHATKEIVLASAFIGCTLTGNISGVTGFGVACVEEGIEELHVGERAMIKMAKFKHVRPKEGFT